jgi:flavin-dependent dehydrogenase
VHRGRLALVGDAAGYLDAITGEGLSLGFHEADALADALAAGDLALYERAVKKLVAMPFALIKLLLFAERHPAIRRRMVGTLAREPELFARVLAIHTRDRPPSSLGIGGALRFMRGLVRA